MFGEHVYGDIEQLPTTFGRRQSRTGGDRVSHVMA